MMSFSPWSTGSSSLRRAVLLPLSLLSMASTCQQCQTIGNPRLGNIDRVSDLVVVAAADGHSYAISANPELLHLRVLDLTEGRFLTGPNRFFPLSIPVGLETRRLTVANDVTTEAVDPSRIFALDNADHKIFVVRTVDAAGNLPPFVVTAEIPLAGIPADLAALRINATTTLLAVTQPDDGTVAVFSVDNAGAATALADVIIPGAGPEGFGGHLQDIVADPLGRAFIVGDAINPSLHALAVDAAAGTVAFDRSIDVGGPVGPLAAGVVDIGDGLAPVVLAMRTDTAAAMVVRLSRPGFPEDRYAVLGGAALPNLGVAAYVPDARSSEAEVTVCCRGLGADAVAADEATASFATVSLADGRLLHLQLAASHLDGIALDGDRRIVRLVDDDLNPPGAPEGIDINAAAELWVPVEGGDALRPTVAFTTVDNLGSPPFVPIVEAGSSLLLTWEGELLRARRLPGVFAPGPGAFEAAVGLAPRDVRVSDLARLIPETQRLGCAAFFDARIRAVDGVTVTIAMEGDAETPFITDADSTACLQGAGDVRLTVLAQGAFVVSDGTVSRGRVAFVGDDADAAFELPGVRMTLTPSSSGRPLAGSKLAIPLDPRVTTMGVDLVGLLSSAAMVPTAIAGGTISIPDAASSDATAVIPARRVVISSGGGASLASCDEAETSSSRVDTLR
jgi:hypothetical protein